jgi:biopolymer transport protein ExbD
MRKFSKGDDEAEINMTPMLDIVFIMLIFFIVTASFTRETGLDLNKPPASNTPPPPPDPATKPIAFVIDNSNRISFDFRPIELGSIRSIIEREHAARPLVPVIIQAGPDAHTGIVVQIHDMAMNAKVTNIVVSKGK